MEFPDLTWFFRGIFILFLALIGIIIWLWLGGSDDGTDWQQQAVDDGAGEFYYDTKTGEKHFRWITEQ